MDLRNTFCHKDSEHFLSYCDLIKKLGLMWFAGDAFIIAPSRYDILEVDSNGDVFADYDDGIAKQGAEYKGFN